MANKPGRKPMLEDAETRSVVLERKTWRALEKEAKARNLGSVSPLVRQAIKAFLNRDAIQPQA